MASPASPDDLDYEDKICGGCGHPVDDGDGVVVAFGNALWHVNCFNCAKCGNRVSPDTNLLLLSDGSPVCASCSYNCAVCKKPISHEAIMTGDESYHAACFACKTCGRHIGELVFAKTTQGIYCMACHNERVARSRRHAEQRKNRSKTASGRDKEKDRLLEQPSIPNLRENGATTPETPPTTPGLNGSQINHADSTISRAAKRVSTQSATLRQYGDFSPRKPLAPIKASPQSTRASSPLPSPSITTTHASPPSSLNKSTPHASHSPQEDRTLVLPNPHVEVGSRRKSFDDGVQPFGSLVENVSTANRPSSSAGTTDLKASRRSPIMPGLHIDQASVESQYRLSPSLLSPVVDSRQSASGSPSHSRDSADRSRSPSLYRGSPRLRPLSPLARTSSPSSPPLTSPGHLQQQHTDPSIPRDTVPIRMHSLPGGASHASNHPPLQSPHSSSGRMSPARPLTPLSPNSGRGTVPEQVFQRHSASSQHSKVSTPMRDLPSLPQGVDSDGGERLTDEDEESGPEERKSLPVALPPMSFSDSESSFGDLLKMGQGDSPRKNSSPERHDSAPKDIVTPEATSEPPVMANTNGRQTKPVPTLTKLPERNQSLLTRHRKHIPDAIILPDTFDTDIAYDIDDYLNGENSPDTLPPRRSLDSAKIPDSGNRLAQRQGIADMLSPRGPASPISPLSRARSSSMNSPATADMNVTTPTRAVSHPNPVVTATSSSAASNRTARPIATGKQDSTELVAKRIKDALADALTTGNNTVKFDREFVEIIFMAVQSNRETLNKMRDRFDGMRRASKHYIDGLSVAQDEYDNEVAARREVEAEVTRLKVQLSGQAALLTELSAGERKRDVAEKISRDISENLHGLERDLSKLKAERDLTAAEVEELVSVKATSTPVEGASVQRNLTKRFDSIKGQYKRELAPLIQQREALVREISELKEERNICLEETTALSARNEELAALIAQMTHQVEAGFIHPPNVRPWPQAGQMQPPLPSMPKHLPSVPHFNPGASTSSMASTIVADVMTTPNNGKKWFKPSKENVRPLADGSLLEKDTVKHNFQLLTVLRFARCDHCGDKMWGTQLRCTMCNIACHNRCVNHITPLCSNEPRLREDAGHGGPLPPSMFGRDLIEQVRADSDLAKEHRDIPIIVEKCITAVEHLAMDYEGIYRKTGGSSQSKVITQLFERGNYDAFDLRNSDAFNDISSVTSVLKTYFRQLPNPLLTHALHDAFSSAAVIRDPRAKAESLSSLVYQLPSEHFHTLRYLMLHLYRVQLRSKENFMNARNLGVVFGPTLMRASDPNREFADMAGKALAIEWLVENAPSVFRDQDL